MDQSNEYCKFRFYTTTPPNRKSKRLETFGKRIFSSTSLALRSVNTACLLGCYNHALCNSVAQVLPMVLEEAWAILTQAMIVGQDTVMSTIQCEVDITDSLGSAISTKVALHRHTWLRSTGFSGDVQAALMDMPFDMAPACSVIRPIQDLRKAVPQHTCWAYPWPRHPHSSFCSFCGYG